MQGGFVSSSLYTVRMDPFPSARSYHSTYLGVTCDTADSVAHLNAADAAGWEPLFLTADGTEILIIFTKQNLYQRKTF